MKLNKHARALAADLNLNEAEAVVMELKAQLYQHAAKSIAKSKLTHEDIAKKIGTSRARITRIANLGENSLSMELLVKIIVTLEHKIPLKVLNALSAYFLEIILNRALRFPEVRSQFLLRPTLNPA